MLQPAQHIIVGLEKMRNGHLDTRIPSFAIKEWKQTSDAINQLATSQEQIISDNKQLALKLMNIQQDEHRYIARELHDEFGQCLAGINAVTTSIQQTATAQCPELVPEIKNISSISRHMMDILRNMLIRLRPVDIDDLGLNSSLEKLIASWNTRSKGQTHYTLLLMGDTNKLAEPLPVNIYRIVQECLTNIAKHANARHASVQLHHVDHKIQLDINDDGVATMTDFENPSGIGLLGIRERVTALGGELNLSPLQKGGLSIAISIPVSKDDSHE
jgi:signal transduction histidine kinase